MTNSILDDYKKINRRNLEDNERFTRQYREMADLKQNHLNESLGQNSLLNFQSNINQKEIDSLKFSHQLEDNMVRDIRRREDQADLFPYSPFNKKS